MMASWFETAHSRLLTMRGEARFGALHRLLGAAKRPLARGVSACFAVVRLPSFRGVSEAKRTRNPELIGARFRVRADARAGMTN